MFVSGKKDKSYPRPLAFLKTLRGTLADIKNTPPCRKVVEQPVLVLRIELQHLLQIR